ncbi:MAG: hypothetical protein Q9214_001167 [Letrouitia sp. 1 TL-2023]
MDFVVEHLTIDFNAPGTIAGLAVSALILYLLALSIYRLTSHPLAKFPGPKIAAATSWYEFYYDWWLQGQYIFEIERMHNKYGPIVRINPEELSIHDPAAYNEIFVTESKRRTDNYNSFLQGVGFEGSHLLTVDHDLHRRRRKPLNPFFSRLGISRLEPVIVQSVKKLVARLELLKGSNTVVRLDHAFTALTGDVIGKVCCDDKEIFLDDPDFASWCFSNHYPIAMKHIMAAKQEKLENDRKGTQASDSISLFRHIINSDMPESERSSERLAKEAQILLAAGTESISRTLGYISYFILANPSLHSRLEEELEMPMSKYPEVVPTWAELEKVPILQAIIKESLRSV